MPDALLPPGPIPRERALEIWAEMWDAAEALVISGLAARYGEDKVEEKFREWTVQQIAANDQRRIRMLTNMSRREVVADKLAENELKSG